MYIFNALILLNQGLDSDELLTGFCWTNAEIYSGLYLVLNMQ